MTFRIGTPHARNAGNLAGQTGGHDSKKYEHDIQCCPHCQAVIKLDVWKDDGGWCGKCRKPICGPCAERALTEGCVPFIARLEREWKMAGKLAQFRKLAGLDHVPTTHTKKIIVGG